MFQRKPRRFRHHRNGRGQQLHGNGSVQTGLRSHSFSNSQTTNNYRTTQSAEKLLEKYNTLAKEAISSGDKTLGENYLQHADHFTRILAEKENLKLSKEEDNKNTIEVVSDNTKSTLDETENQEKQILKT